MGIIFFGLLLILAISFLVTSVAYKRMVKNEVRMAGLWATVIFIGLAGLALTACFYAFLVNFSR